MKKIMIVLLACSTALFFGCGQGGGHSEGDGHDHGDHEGHDHGDHAAHGPHGGELLEVGEHLAHVELIHDQTAKTVTLHMLGADAKTALTLEEAPKLNLMIGGEAVQVATEGSGSEFKAMHEAFAGEPEGKIALKFEGKMYQVELAHAHHDHDDHAEDHDDHEGHEHN
jgi:hypothetical protein